MNWQKLPLRRKVIIGLIGLAIATAVSVVAVHSLTMGKTMTQTPVNESMPGMDHGSMSGTSEMSGMGGHDMSPINVNNAPPANLDARGNQLLEPKLVDGVKEFNLTVGVVRWSILPDVTVGAYAYNGQVPGPLIRVNAGDKVRIKVKNELAEPTSVHWHGLAIPNSQDGAADVTQPPIQPGETFTYEYAVPNTPGTYFYHTHYAGDRQQPVGLYGALIIDSPTAQKEYNSEYIVELGEWRVTNGQTFPAMEFDGMLPNYFTINGKSYPSTEIINAKVGDRILIRFIGSGQFIHPMHIHGGAFEIVATDGNPVQPSERYGFGWTRRTVRCNLESATTGEMVDSLPHQSPYHQQWSRGTGRWWLNDGSKNNLKSRMILTIMAQGRTFTCDRGANLREFQSKNGWKRLAFHYYPITEARSP